jgi:hypothetical protein
MGLPFPVYGEKATLEKLSAQRRQTLKEAIRAFFRFDPEIRGMLEKGTTLDNVREKLKEKTQYWSAPPPG